MRAEKTSTIETLLGMLTLGSMSGYELKQVMERSTANFWSESFGQIYPALRRMVEEDLVTVEEKIVAGRAKKVYRIAREGELRLHRWLEVPFQPQVRRNELLLKVFFGDQALPGVVAAHVVRAREGYEDDLQRYEAALLRMETQHPRDPGLPYWKMTVRYGMAEARALIGWCDETLAELEKRGLLKRVVSRY
jgi:PadR family transcriptional regulator AphA